MLLFVGLGNPTPNSENNRHNIGFKIIDAINQKFRLSKPGFDIIIVPTNPNPTAIQRFNLIVSLKKNILNITTHKGALKANAVTSASCKFLNPIKIAAIAIAPKNDL